MQIIKDNIIYNKIKFVNSKEHIPKIISNLPVKTKKLIGEYLSFLNTIKF